MNCSFYISFITFFKLSRKAIRRFVGDLNGLGGQCAWPLGERKEKFLCLRACLFAWPLVCLLVVCYVCLSVYTLARVRACLLACLLALLLSFFISLACIFACMLACSRVPWLPCMLCTPVCSVSPGCPVSSGCTVSPGRLLAFLLVFAADEFSLVLTQTLA